MASNDHAYLRAYASSSATQLQPRLDNDNVPKPQADRPPVPQPDPKAANPPSTTRPPPLQLPERKPDSSTFSHLYATGKAYLTFYKTGVKQIYTNTKLVRAVARSPSSSSSSSADDGTTEEEATPPRPGTRAHHLLRQRWRHDIGCLPPFALIFLICGELTPIVVLAVPRAVPFTCRIPRQVEQLLQEGESRRRAAFGRWIRDRADANSPSASSSSVHGVGGDYDPLQDERTLAHVARVLGVVTRLWDRLGVDPPASFVERRVVRWVEFLVRDDTLLLEAGGVPALEDDEVRLACTDRGINVLGRDTEELRSVLQVWLDLLASDQDSGLDDRVRRAVLLLTRPQEEWLVASE